MCEEDDEGTEKLQVDAPVYQLQNGNVRLESGKLVLPVSYSATEKWVNVHTSLLRMNSERYLQEHADCCGAS